MNGSKTSRAGFAAVALVAGGLALGMTLAPGLAAGEARAIPAPAENLAASGATEVAVLAGGCFWGVQGVFQHVEGVVQAVSGYAGGDERTAQYEKVSSGSTGHAEAVRVTYDPQRVSFGRILQIYFSVAHDPTQLNRQGPDHGTQYRSAIFPQSVDQARVAKAYIAQLDGARAYEAGIVTKIEMGRPFYAAEGYHQDFMERHPSHPYIVINDAPKIEGLRRVYPDVYRSEPKLVAAAD